MISRFGAIDTDPVEAVKKINRLGTGSLIRFHGAFSNENLQEVTDLQDSKRKKNIRDHKLKSLSSSMLIRCIDNWYRLLDKLSMYAVLRSS